MLPHCCISILCILTSFATNVDQICGVGHRSYQMLTNLFHLTSVDSWWRSGYARTILACECRLSDLTRSCWNIMNSRPDDFAQSSISKLCICVCCRPMHLSLLTSMLALAVLNVLRWPNLLSCPWVSWMLAWISSLFIFMTFPGCWSHNLSNSCSCELDHPCIKDVYAWGSRVDVH